MNEPPIYLANNTYLPESSCIAYDFGITNNIANYIHEPHEYFTKIFFFNKFYKEYISPLFIFCVINITLGVIHVV